MAQMLLVLPEVLAMLETIGVPGRIRDQFQKQAEFALKNKARGHAPDNPEDAVTVSSGYGKTGGFVEFTLNDQLSQMKPAKAREIAIMLLQASEAAISDEIFVTLIRDRVGITDHERLGRILIDLREIRQGTRGIAWPT